jgi:hypothetical protein
VQKIIPAHQKIKKMGEKIIETIAAAIGKTLNPSYFLK